MRNAIKLCTVPGCGQSRHLSYSRCEAHQKAYWNERDAVKKQYTPRQSKGALLEDGTRRTVGKPRKNAPKPVGEKIADLMVQVEADAKKRETIKVVVINRAMDIAQLVEVPVLSDIRFSEIRRPDDLLRLLRGSGHIVVYADRDKI